MLVTSGAGLIGSNSVHYMLKKYDAYRIVVLDKPTDVGRLVNLERIRANPCFGFVDGDICDLDAVMSAVRAHKIDTIINFAAEAHVDRSIMQPDVVVRINVNGA